jgi:hypothetical protein
MARNFKSTKKFSMKLEKMYNKLDNDSQSCAEQVYKLKWQLKKYPARPLNTAKE